MLAHMMEDIQYLTHTLKNKERHTHEKYDTLMADVTRFGGKRHRERVSDTEQIPPKKGNADKPGTSVPNNNAASCQQQQQHCQ